MLDQKEVTDRKDFIAMDTATLKQQKDTLAAFNTWISMSGKTDKQICAEIEIDPAQWSRIRSGLAHFPISKYRQLADFLKSDGFLQYLMWDGDYEPKLIMRKSKLERELDDANRRIAELEKAKQILTEAIGGRFNG